MNKQLAGYCTTLEAAKLIGVTPSRVCQMLRNKGMRGQKFGKAVWMIPKKEVDRVKKIPQVTGRPRVGVA